MVVFYLSLFFTCKSSYCFSSS